MNLYKDNHGRLTEKKPKATKLTAENVIEIRRLAKEGVIFRILGEQFGVKAKTVSRVVNRETWEHLP